MLRRERSRILVVEPDQRVREFLADALAENAEVTQAAGPFEALRVLSSIRAGQPRFDLAIVDCGEAEHRGRWRGVELVRMLAAREPRLPVIVISAAVDADRIAAEAFRHGAREFLKKPFGMGELTAAIARVSSMRAGSDGARAVSKIRSLL